MAITGQVLVPLVLKVTAKPGVMALVDGKMGDVVQYVSWFIFCHSQFQAFV